MCTFERDCCLPLLGLESSAAFINPTLLHLFAGFGKELSNPLSDFFNGNYEVEMMQKKKHSPETKGIWVSINLWSKAELDKGLTAWKRLKLIFCACVNACLYLNLLLSFMILGSIMGYIWQREVAWLGVSAGMPVTPEQPLGSPAPSPGTALGQFLQPGSRATLSKAS